MKRRSVIGVCAGVGLSLATLSVAGDWDRFRGPNGSGVSPDAQAVPVTWSDTENLKWKLDLPGPGSSSPVVVGDRVLVTCWSGYATQRGTPGDPKDLRRHLLCVDRETGHVLWNQSVEPALPEDPYSGMFTEHGYASHSPVSDGQRVYAFFGKTGAVAFDLDGKKLWQKGLGTESGPMGWGTASSPILYKNLLIVTASAESEALVALNKETGDQVWRKEARGFSGTWGTPVLVDCGGGRTDLVLAVPQEIWGFNPEDGKLRWYCESIPSDSLCSSAIAQDGMIYVMETGPRGGGTIAVRAGGEGDVTKTHVVWRGRDRSRISTPVFHEGRLYWVSSRIANCIDAQTGARVFEQRLAGASPGTSDVRPSPPGPGGRPGGGGRGGQDYSSPVVADGKLYFFTRAGDGYVLQLGKELVELARNRFASEDGDFSATPAISKGQLFIRSSKRLYCVATKARP
jgi:outer membrane protein assembly factor BamB